MKGSVQNSNNIISEYNKHLEKIGVYNSGNNNQNEATSLKKKLRIIIMQTSSDYFFIPPTTFYCDFISRSYKNKNQLDK